MRACAAASKAKVLEKTVAISAAGLGIVARLIIAQGWRQPAATGGSQAVGGGPDEFDPG